MRYIAWSTLVLVACLPPPFREVDLPELPSAGLAAAVAVEEEPSLEWPSPAWWQAFGDSQLDLLVQLALEQNPTIAERAEHIVQAAAAIRLAESQEYPQVNLVPKYLLNRIAPLGLGGMFLEPWQRLTTLFQMLTVQAQWMVDVSGQVALAMSKAEAEVHRRDAELAMTRLLVSAQTASSYVGWQAAQQRMQKLQEAVASAKQITYLEQLLRNNSLQTVQGTALAEQEQATISQQLAHAQLAVEELEHLLQRVVAQSTGALPPLEEVPLEDLLGKHVQIPATLPLELVARRPDLIAARWQAETAARAVRLSRTAWYPNFNLLSGSFGFQTDDWFEMMTSKNLAAAIGPAISLPWFDGSSRNAIFDQRLSQYYAAIDAYQEALLRATQQVLNAISAVRQGQRNLLQATAARSAAQARLQMVQELFEGQLANRMELEKERIALLVIDLDYIGAMEELLLAMVSLDTQLGGGYSYQGPPVPTPVGTPRAAP